MARGAQPRDHASMEERRLARARRADDRQLRRIAQALDECVDFKLTAEVEPAWCCSSTQQGHGTAHHRHSCHRHLRLNASSRTPTRRARPKRRLVFERTGNSAPPLLGCRCLFASSSQSGPGFVQRCTAHRCTERMLARQELAITMPRAQESTRSSVRHCSLLGSIQSGVPRYTVSAYSR